MQSAHKLATDEIREEMAQMRTDLRFVLKHVTSCAETVNAVNYFYKTRPRTDEYYYKEDCYVVNEPTGVFRADRGFTTKHRRLQSGKLASRYRK